MNKYIKSFFTTGQTRIKSKIQFSKFFCTTNQGVQSSIITSADVLPAQRLNFEILHANLEKVKISIEENKLLSDLENMIKKENKFMTVEFKTWDNSIISKNNKLKSFFEHGKINPIFLRINKLEWQILQGYDDSKQTQINLNPEFNRYVASGLEINNNIADVKYELPLTMKYINSELHYVFDNLKLNNKNPNLTDEDLSMLTMQIYSIKHFERNFTHKQSIEGFKNLTEVFENLSKLKTEFVKLDKLKENLYRKCQLKARLLLCLGGLLFVLEFLFVYYGTFIYFSWDITEPITYLIGCVNIVLAVFLKKRMGSDSAITYFTKKYFNKLIRKGKFDQNNFNNVHRRLIELEKILNN